MTMVLSIDSASICDPDDLTEAWRQPAPFAAVFGHIQDRVKHFEIGEAHIAALTWEASLYPTILGLCDLHSPNILQIAL